MVDTSRAFEVTAGRHPVVERALRKQASGPFVANDCALTAPAIWLLTGPNMAGKSTFLRQNALIALLAQAGSFVPAAQARVGLVSQHPPRRGRSPGPPPVTAPDVRAGDTVAGPFEAARLFDIEVDQVARPRVLITAHRFGRVDPRQQAKTRAPEPA